MWVQFNVYFDVERGLHMEQWSQLTKVVLSLSSSARRHVLAALKRCAMGAMRHILCSEPSCLPALGASFFLFYFFFIFRLLSF